VAPAEPTAPGAPRAPARALSRLISVAIVAYAAASLWPYDFALPSRVENGAAPAPEGGLSFSTPGLAESDGPPPWIGEALACQRLELDLSLRSAAPPGQDFTPILSLSRERYDRNLAIGQEGRDLLLHLRDPDTRPKGRNYRLADVFPAPVWIDVDVVIEPGRLRVSIDGETRLDRKLPERPLATWNPGFRLALGNELAGNRPWLGDLRRAIVRAGEAEVDVADPDVLRRPSRYWYVRTTPQLVPLLGSSSDDMLVNAVLYVPLGLLLGARRRAGGGRPRLRPWACVLLVSGTIELLQLFVVPRCASTGDVLLNVAGGAVGGWLGSAWTSARMARHS